MGQGWLPPTLTTTTAEASPLLSGQAVLSWPGSTTWAWRTCEGSRCLQVVYADSLNAVAAPGVRFTGDATRPSIEATFRRSVSAVGRLPCDILLTVHPSFAGMDDKLKRRREQPDSEPFVDPAACRAYAAAAANRLEQRIADEGKSALH